MNKYMKTLLLLIVIIVAFSLFGCSNNKKEDELEKTVADLQRKLSGMEYTGTDSVEAGSIGIVTTLPVTTTTEAIAPKVSLSTLGFSYSEKDALCIYEDKEEGIQVAICKPQWGVRPTTDNNWNIEYLNEVNGYLLAVWYYANEQKYTVQADKDGSMARYDYFIKTGEYGSEWTSDSDTVKEHFSTVFDTKDDNVFAKAVAMFTQTLKDRFKMSMEELYALPIK